MKVGSGFLGFILLVSVSLFSCKSNPTSEVKIYKGDVFDDSVVHEIKLNFADKNYWDSLVKYKLIKDSMEINHFYKCNVTIDGNEIKDIGVRLKGESSYDFTKGKKKSFKLDFNCFVRKQKYCGVTRINLNNNYKDPSLMREKITLDMLAKEGLPTSRSAYAKVYLNDEYWGLYLMVEGINKDFLKRNFNNASGNLYIGEPNGTLEKLATLSDYARNYRKKNNKKENDWSDLIQFISTVNSENTAKNQGANLDSIFNLDNCLKTWAINNLLVNVDAYNMMYPHNYFLYSDSISGKLQWINYDYNYSFAAWNPKYTYSQVCEFPIFYNNPSLPLANLVLSKNKQIQKRYLTTLQSIFANQFTEEHIDTEVKRLYTLIKEAVYEDNRKEFSNEDFEKNCSTTLGDKNDPGAFIPGLKEFVHDRKMSVLKQTAPLIN